MVLHLVCPGGFSALHRLVVFGLTVCRLLVGGLVMCRLVMNRLVMCRLVVRDLILRCPVAMLRLAMLHGRSVIVRLCCELGNTLRPGRRMTLWHGFILMIGRGMIRGHSVRIRMSGLRFDQQRAVPKVMGFVVIIAML